MEYIKLIIFIIFTISIFSFLSLAPWVPTRKKDLWRINNILKLKEWEKFLEIWCGTSNVSIFLAKNNPDASITWIELSPFLYLVSKVKVFFSWCKNIKIVYWNALKLKLSEYDTLYVFGLPETISEKLFPKISHINKENFRLISYCFKMKNDKFIETKYKENKCNSIYEYKLK